MISGHWQWANFLIYPNGNHVIDTVFDTRQEAVDSMNADFKEGDEVRCRWISEWLPEIPGGYPAPEWPGLMGEDLT